MTLLRRAGTGFGAALREVRTGRFERTLAGVAAAFSARAARTVLPLTSAAIVINGLQGTYLHGRGIGQRPGGWTRCNMEGGPPMFAPLLASLVGGLAAVLRREGQSAGGVR